MKKEVEHYGVVEIYSHVHNTWSALTQVERLDSVKIINAIHEEVALHKANRSDLRIRVVDEKEVYVERTCNLCGCGCGDGFKKGPLNFNKGLIDATVTGGYSSPIIPDMTSHTFSLCEYCVVWLFDVFLIKHKFTDLDPQDESSQAEWPYHRDRRSEPSDEEKRRDQIRRFRLKNVHGIE